MKASHCDKCQHATLKRFVYRGPPAFDVLTCAKGHKPRHYMPRSVLDTEYGRKRVCADFLTHNEHFDGLPVSPTKAQLDAAIDAAMQEDKQ